jgi:cytoskeletal protein CcmA (bactofilin family)
MKVSRQLCSRYLPAVLTAAAMFTLLAASATASVLKSENNIQISNLHVIDDDFYAFGENLTMDGTIEGDLLALVSQATIRGEVTQSACVACQTLKFSGSVGNSLRAAGINLDIDGSVGRSVDVFGTMIRISRGAVITREVNAFGDKVYIDGQVGGKVYVRANEVFITGTVDGDAEIRAKKITISPPASITGSLTYMAPAADSLVIDAGADVSGEVKWEPMKEEKQEKTYTWFILRVSSMLAALIFGVIVVRLFRPYATESFVQLRSRFAMSSAAGLLGLLGLIFCIVILVIALFFLAIGYVLLTSEGATAGLGLLFLVFSSLMIPITAFGSVAGGIILYSGKIIIAFLIGYFIVRGFRPNPKPLSSTSLFLGLLILLILYSLPYIGTIVYLLSMIIGAGAILLGIRFCRKDKHPPVEPAAPESPGPPLET